MQAGTYKHLMERVGEAKSQLPGCQPRGDPPGAEPWSSLRAPRRSLLCQPPSGRGRKGGSARARTCPARQHTAGFVRMNNEYFITDLPESHPNCFVTGCRDAQSAGNSRVPEVCTACGGERGLWGAGAGEAPAGAWRPHLLGPTPSRVLPAEVARGASPNRASFAVSLLASRARGLRAALPRGRGSGKGGASRGFQRD